MQAQDKSFQPYVYNFANEFKMAKKLLKVRSINNYHLCLSNCFNHVNAQDSEFCQRNCEIDYQNYVEFKRKVKIADVSYFLFSPEGMFDTKDPQQLNQLQDYQRRSVDMEMKMKSYIQNMTKHLDEIEKRYKDAAKKK